MNQSAALVVLLLLLVAAVSAMPQQPACLPGQFFNTQTGRCESSYYVGYNAYLPQKCKDGEVLVNFECVEYKKTTEEQAEVQDPFAAFGQFG